MTEYQSKLVENNMGLVHDCRMRYYKKCHFANTADFENFMSYGKLGLVKAALSHDETKGKFSVYAYVCIKSGFAHYFVDVNRGKNKFFEECFRLDRITENDESIDGHNQLNVCDYETGYMHIEIEDLITDIVDSIGNRKNGELTKQVFNIFLHDPTLTSKQIGDIVNKSSTTVEKIIYRHRPKLQEYIRRVVSGS